MFERSRWPVLALLLAGGGLLGVIPGRAQDTPPPPVPQGIEVLARGPVHEAYASLTTEAVPTTAIALKPPAPIEEMPPAEKPEGDAVWISGYWTYDDDRRDFLWVSGVWRTVPPGKQWIAGYWREDNTQWQWVPGFWAAGDNKTEVQQMSYLPEPPAPPAAAKPGPKPVPESFYVPGSWVWNGTTYAWRAGYWARVQPGYLWINDHFRWTPSGYVYIGGYWDLALKNRGILYAPVLITPSVVTVGFVYTPAYAVRDTVVVDAMFVRPTTCHYYFGDYYEPRYRTMGFQCSIVYSQSHYDSIVVYETYERRSDPTWLSLQINLYNGRCAGTAPCPPRTLAAQTTIINNTTIVNNTTIINNNITMLAPAHQVAAQKGVRLARIDNATRMAARQQARAIQQVAHQRVAMEKPLPPGAPRQARVASLSVPKAQPVKPGMKAPEVKPVPKNISPPHPASPAKSPTTAAQRSAPPQKPAPNTGRPPATNTGRTTANTTKPTNTSRPPARPATSGTTRPGTTPPGTRPGTPPQKPGTPPQKPGTPPQKPGTPPQKDPNNPNAPAPPH